MNQSPIDLDSSMKAEVHAPINFRNYFNGHFNKHFKGTLRNTGTSVQWNINHLDNNQLYGGAMWRWKNPSIRDGPYGGKTHTHTYYLWQLHFHWGEPGMTDKGSEHTVDGKMYPMEMHMVHVEDNFIGKKGYVKVSEAIESPHGLAVLGIFFHIDNSKPQNQEPMSEMDDKVWEMHWPGAHSSKRSANPLLDASMDLDEAEEKQMEYDHSLNVRSLSYGFSNLDYPIMMSKPEHHTLTASNSPSTLELSSEKLSEMELIRPCLLIGHTRDLLQLQDVAKLLPGLYSTEPYLLLKFKQTPSPACTPTTTESLDQHCQNKILNILSTTV